MNTRLVAAATVLLAAGAAGCSAPPAALGGTTAKVTINGKSTGDPHPVRCSQSGWLWTIETPDQGKGFSADLDTGDAVTVRAVTFSDFAGFTGNFWRDNIGEAEVTGNGGKFTITGSADGSFADNPSNAVTATFRIEANC
ncbi:lipoprotein antigen [Mycolicibacterium rutilum]|uniref:Lipoprotein antigen n=1 Tax=Mycolicibacterium rutilum TaxID=370526 RepID=A0A1H6KVS2_MYCRU|nr:lipoprotein LpqH [Mycolicibacterium rutilum]SEH77715.1 lipoprotein antigen [Mycolicibacterium rutilum]